MLDEERQWLRERDSNTAHIREKPYDCDPYIRRAACYEKLGYPDLAAGDAYRALLLTDEVLDESGEWHELAVEALESTVKKADWSLNDGAESGLSTNGVVTGIGHTGGKQHEERSDMAVDGKEDDPWYQVVAEGYARRSYEMLARTLADCGDLKAAYDFTERGLKVFPSHGVFTKLQEQILHKHCQSRLQKDPGWDLSDFNPRTDLSENGIVRREIYPWNRHESDRFSEDSMSLLNVKIRKVASKCEVRAVELPILNTQAFDKEGQKPATVTQMGVFASEDISPNETVLLEPSVLTSSTRLFDPLCDACSSALPMVHPDHPLPSCPDCADIVFCSEACLAHRPGQRRTCLPHPRPESLSSHRLRTSRLRHRCQRSLPLRRLQRPLHPSHSPNTRNGRDARHPPARSTTGQVPMG